MPCAAEDLPAIRDAVAERLAKRTGSVLVVSDGSAFLDDARDALGDTIAATPHAGRLDVRIGARGDIRDVESVVDAWRSVSPSLIVALGGGSVLDVVKLARAVVVGVLGPEQLDTVRSSLEVTAIGAGTSQLLLVATRVGSGSPWTPKAVVRNHHGVSRLVYAEHRPAAIGFGWAEVCDTLPRPERALDAAEILSRALGPYLDGDHLPERLVDFVARWGRVADAFVEGTRPVGPMAALSAETHDRGFHAGADPFGFTLWMATMALVDLAGVRKSVAMARAVPTAVDELAARAPAPQRAVLDAVARQLETFAAEVVVPAATLPGVDDICDRVAATWPGPYRARRVRGRAELVLAGLAGTADRTGTPTGSAAGTNGGRTR